MDSDLQKDARFPIIFSGFGNNSRGQRKGAIVIIAMIQVIEKDALGTRVKTGKCGFLSARTCPNLEIAESSVLVPKLTEGGSTVAST